MTRESFVPQSASAYGDYQRQRTMTLGDLLLENRIILLQGEIYDGNANELVMKLLYLQSENRRKDINFYINSPGGSVTATMAIMTPCRFSPVLWQPIVWGLQQVVVLSCSPVVLLANDEFCHMQKS